MLKILLLIIMIVPVPVILGMGICRKEDHLPLIWVKGYLVMLALIFWPAFLGGAFHTSLKLLIIVYSCLTAAGLILCVALNRSRIKAILKRDWRLLKKTAGQLSRHKTAGALGLIASLLIAVQMLMPVFFIHIDEDDATYVAMATVAVDTNTVLDYEPSTGEPLTGLTAEEYADTLMGRYLISPMYAFFAVPSVLTGIRPAVLCHTALPGFLTLMAYIVYAGVGWRLFKRSFGGTALFLIFLSVIHIAAYVSPYTAGSFLLLRIWQGKGQFAGILAPMMLLIFMDLAERQDTRQWFYMAAVLMAAAVMTPMGNLLAIVEMGTGTLALMCIKRKNLFAIAFRAAACMAVPLGVMAYYALFLK